MEFIKKCMSAAPASFQDQYAKLHEQAQGELDKAAAAALELKEQASGGASGSSEPGSPELTGSLSATETSGSGFFPSLFRFMKDPKATAAGACSQLQDEVKNQGETEQDSGDGPVDRIRKYMRGELDFKGLGVCNCFIGPTVKPELQSNPKNKSAYGLGVCVCCIGGEKTKEQEADARKQVRMMLHKKFYGAGERPPLATGGAQGKVAQLEQDTVPTMQGAKARVGARMERIAALQNRAEERFQKAHEKFHDKGEGSVAHRAQQILAMAQLERNSARLQDMGEAPISLATRA